jgi:mannosyl-oligosaccharide alpha-1,2-mannosidase
MLTRKLFPVYLLTGLTLIIFFCLLKSRDVISVPIFLGGSQFHRPPIKDGQFPWSARPENHPVLSLIPLPTGSPVKIPPIQHQFAQESANDLLKRNKRRQKVKETFTRAWNGYRDHAWMKDELSPISGNSLNRFGGWAATLVDSLDTLWIMDMKAEFEEAVESVKQIDFTTTDEDELNIFETTIRYLGGLLAAFDLSGGQYPVILNKAVELGDMLYAAFDTPNRMPITRWHWKT